MLEKIKKSYNPFKMWGSWVGFVIGLLALLSSVVPQGLPVVGFFSMFLPTNILIWVLFFVPYVFTMFTTPIVFFLYGWGIHSIFRKLDKKSGVMLIISIVVLVIGVLTVVIIQENQADQANRAANPYLNYSEPVLMSKSNDVSIDINMRLTMLTQIATKIPGMSLEQKKKLSEQLSSFDLSQLSEMNKSRMKGRISILQQLLATK